MTATWIAIGGLAALSLVEAVAIVALAREVGLMSLRLPAAPALESGDGPAIGSTLPPCAAPEVGTSDPRPLDGRSERPRVLVFLSTRCGSCRVLLHDLAAVEGDWPEREFQPIVSGSESEVMAMARESGYDGRLYLDRGDKVMQQLGVRVTPTAVVVDEEGVVRAQGVVNNREMVSSLLSGNVRVNHDLVDTAPLRVEAIEGGSP